MTSVVFIVVIFFLFATFASAVRLPTSHRCIHDTSNVQNLFWKNAKAQAEVKRRREEHLSKVDQAHPRSQSHHDLRALATTSQPAGLRIALVTDDLYDTTKYCAAIGDQRPDFQGNTVTCTADDVLSDAKRTLLLEKILPAAVAKLERALLVETPRTDNIVVSTCSTATVNSTISSAGVAGADFVLFVTAGQTPTNVLAWASTCMINPGTQAPIAGHMNFGPSYITYTDVAGSYADMYVVSTATHELLHAVGFSASAFATRFKDSPFATTTISTRGGKTATLLNTSATVDAVRNYFNCSTAVGAEIEDEGGSGSAGSHLDQRVFPQDVMASSSGLLLSNITLAVMHDSGHFIANFSAVDKLPAPMLFGRNAGCGFIDEQCNTAAGGKDTSFCFTSSSNTGCTADGSLSIGACSVQTYNADLPSYFQYFSGEPKKGGLTFYDGCPIINAYSNRRCAFTGTSSSSDDFFGHVFSSTSRCFETSNPTDSNNNGVIQSGLTSAAAPQRCYEMNCIWNASSAVRLQVRVGTTSTWLDCPADGSAGTVNAPSGFTGLIHCPVATSMCIDESSFVTGVSGSPTTTTTTTTAASTSASGATPAPTTTTTTTTESSNTTTNTTANETTTTTTTTTSASTSNETTVATTTTTTTTTAAPTTPAPPVVAVGGGTTTARVGFQLTSALALGQMSTAKLAAIQTALKALAVAAVGADVFILADVQAFMDSSGRTIVRTSIAVRNTSTGIATLANTTTLLSTALASALDNSTSALSVAAVPSSASSSSLAQVVDCTTVCSSTGTQASSRNADNTACVCTCRNKFSDSTCSTCASPYAGSACSQCEDGKSGYPECVSESTCSQPTAERYSDTTSTACDAAISTTVATAERLCLRTQCTCLGGTWTEATQICTSLSSTLTACATHQCDGTLRECLFDTKLAAMRRQPSVCSSDATRFALGQQLSRQWCSFDACLNSDLSTCTAVAVTQGCSASTNPVGLSNAAAHSLIAIFVMMVAVFVLLV